MNLKGLRTAVFSQADWAPTQSADALTRLNGFINRAYFQIAQEAPFLFFESELRFVTQPDLIPTLDGDTISIVATDPWVFERDVSSAVVASSSDLSVWDSTGRWDGRMLEITDSSDVVRRRRIRSVFEAPDILGATTEQLTIYQPWPNRSETGMSYRIYDDSYYLPDDVIEVNSLRLYKAGQAWPLDIMGQLEAEKLSLTDLPGQVAAGVPRAAFRKGHFQIETPTLAPRAETVDGAWAGPEPMGEFSYLYTYCWGRRDQSLWNAGPATTLAATVTTSRYEPLWESAPSPAASVTVDSTGERIEITTPDIQYIQGFGDLNTPRRTNQSGWYKRIYRKRLSTNSGYLGITNSESGVSGDPVKTVEAPNTYLLWEEATGSTVLTYDDGTVLPDYHRRLREVHGYQGLKFYPRPDGRYEVEVRCTRRPEELRDDQDVPRIHRDAMDVLIHRALALLYEAQGNLVGADRALNRYHQDLIVMTKRYGDLRYPGEVLLKRPVRSGRISETRRPFRRWYNLP